MTSDTDELSTVRAAIEAAYDEGCPVAREAAEIAPVALRRWRSFERRGLNIADRTGRIRDLAKGLAQHLESDIQLVGPLMRDYEFLASKIAEVL